METRIIKRYLKTNQYYPRGYEKTQIFIHHTAGTTASGAMDWWDQTPDHVGTAYVIDRDGTIYEAFNPEHWAYHIGRSDDADYVEKHGVGIEIVAAGELYERKDGKVFFLPLYPNKIVKTLIPEEDVVRLKKKWRGHKLYHSYNDKQIISLCWLLGELMVRFNIPIQADHREMFQYDESGEVLKGKPGIWGHSTVRRDKRDMAPQPQFIKILFGYLDNIKKRKSKASKTKKSSNK